MTTVWVDCPYCEAKKVELEADDIIIQIEGPEARTGTYRWSHDCNGGPIVTPASQRIVAILLAAGCRYEYTGDEAIIDTARRQLDKAHTPADMGFVS